MIDETKSETEEQMDKTILSLEKKLQRIRTGRANPSLHDYRKMVKIFHF